MMAKNFFGHICRMQDDRLIKQVVFGMMDGKNKRGIPKRRWTDDLMALCNKDICIMLAMDTTLFLDMAWTPTNIDFMEQERERKRERERERERFYT